MCLTSEDCYEAIQTLLPTIRYHSCCWSWLQRLYWRGKELTFMYWKHECWFVITSF
jgi:hypothetical protein